MSTSVRASSTDGERLRVVFISTEVAPWSKVGGLADVLASLPAALVARGHTVVTVAPRYLEYPDTTPTGITVPIDLPPACSTTSTTDLHFDLDRNLASSAGASAITNAEDIVQHTPRRRRRGRRRRQREMEQQRKLLEHQIRSLAATNISNSLAAEAAAAVATSAVLSHADLFHTKQAGVERVFVDHPALRTEDIYGGTVSGGGSLTYMEAGDLDGLELRYNILCQAALGAAALLPQLHQQGSDETGMKSDNGGGIVFVANDWPTALQLLRLQYIIKQQSSSSSDGNDGSGSSGSAAFTSSSFFSGDEYSKFLKSRLFTAATAMCIHNLAYQGIFPASVFSRLCLPDAAFDALSSQSDWKAVLESIAMTTALEAPETTAGSASGISIEEEQRETAAAACLCPPTEPCTCPDAAIAAIEKNDALSLETSLSRPLIPCSTSNTTTTTTRTADILQKQQRQLVGDLNFLRAGLLCADEIITVSPTYAQEIQTQADMGCGLQGILSTRGVTGIMNGIDTEEWDPANDILLPEDGRYGIKNMVAGKLSMKAKVQRRLGLEENPDAALVVFIGRLTEQKGLDVLLGAIPAVFAGTPAPAPVRYQPTSSSLSLKLNSDDNAEEKESASNRLQVAMLGTGEAWIQAALTGLELSFSGRAVGVTAFSEELAHWLLAAADYVIIPSRFEPCGLVAQCGVRYGAVPLVTAVGGLKDLVQPGIGYTLSPLSPPGDALSRRADVDALADLLRRAETEAGTYSHRMMQRNCMEAELSWRQPAVEWENVLRKLSKLHSATDDDDVGKEE